MNVIECVPNVSEGRRLDRVARLAAAIESVAAVKLLDRSSDAAHNRSVFTFAGNRAAIEEASLALVAAAVKEIDLRAHRGVHPRLGAVDVVPFVPLAHATMADAVDLARRVAREIAARFALPVFLYGEAATSPARTRLEDIRRGGFEGLSAKMREPAWAPDYGPPAPHPTAGATVVGARGILVAFNVNLATDRLSDARAIARKVRESGGGLRSVKAMGVALEDRGIVQVSMNLTDYKVTSVARAFDAVSTEAGRLGVEVLESEIVGLAPRAALEGRPPAALRLVDFNESRVLEQRLAESGLVERSASE